MNTLLLGIAGSGKTHECIRRAEEALSAGQEVLYLVPNGEEAALVRARIVDKSARRAAFLPGILTFGALVRRSLEVSRPQAAFRGTLRRRLALAELLRSHRGKLGSLEESAKTPGFPEVLDRLFSELIEGQLDSGDLRSLAGPRPAALANLFEAYLRSQSELGPFDPAPAMHLACEDLEANSELLPPAELLIIDGFSNLSPLQLRLLEALMSRADESLFSVCMDPGDLPLAPRAPFERLHRLAASFAHRENWQVESLDGTPRYQSDYPARLARDLFRKLPGEAMEEIPEDIALLEAASRRDEAEAIARELRLLLAEGVDAGRLAVLYRDADLGDILASTFLRAELPFMSSRKQGLGRTALAGVLTAMLDWHASGGDQDLPQRLRGAYLGADDELLVRMQTEGRLRAIPLEASWDDLFQQNREAEPEGEWAWLDWRAALPTGAMSSAEWLAQVFQPLCTLLSKKLTQTFTQGEGGNLPLLAGELRDLEDILAAAKDLAAAENPRQSASAWLAALNAALETVEARRPEGGEGGGILLGNPFEMRLPELDTVFVAGLSRGSFPPPHREDPLLRENERQTLNRRFEESGRIARLTLRADRQAEERYLFYIAATRASRRLILSWSVRDLEGRVTPPSFFLDELARIAPLPPARFVPGKSLDEKFARPVDLRDLLRNLLLARSRGLSHPELDEAESFLREQGEGRILDAFSTPNILESMDDHPRLAELLSRYRKFSPTGLEAYAHCPYRFLMERILKLEDDEDLDAGPKEEGLLYHKVLELFFRDWDGSTEIDNLDERLKTLYPEAVESLLKGGQAAFQSRAFRVEDSRRMRILSGFLERDLTRLEKTDMRPDPKLIENFLQVDSEAIPGEGEKFMLRGFVDRVDLTRDGRSLVVDYKRSSRSLEKIDVDTPMSFQLPVYAWSLDKDRTLGAAFAAIGDPKKPLSGYYRKEAEAEPLEKSLPGQWLSSKEWDAWLEKVAIRIRNLVDEIAQGRFDPHPADIGENCHRCSVEHLCRWREGEAPVKGGGNE